jgi:hypothetical protein
MLQKNHKEAFHIQTSFSFGLNPKTAIRKPHKVLKGSMLEENP